MTLILMVLFGLFGVPFVIGPPLVYFTTKLPVQLTYQNRRREEFPPDAQGYIAQAEFLLGNEGFFTVFYLHQTIAGNQSYIAVMLNPKTRDMAKIATIHTSGTAGNNKMGTIIFYTRYVDGQEVITANVKQPALFPRPLSGVHALRFSHIQDVRYLFQVHRERAIRVAPQMQTAFPAQGEEWNYFYHSEAGQWARRAQTGEDIYQSGHQYHFTLKGALMSAWGLAWPVTYFRDRRAEHQARETLKQLGM